jgi:glycosyltransferase involved in cell wall biosynthesis
MKISFVIPAYNEEHYIGDCLDAIIGQKKEFESDVEIIVANNASTDGTAEVVKKYPGVKLVDEPHKGIVWARRAGYLASSGDLIANIDADTRITPGWLKKVMHDFSNDDQLVGLSGPFVFYDLPANTLWWVKVFNGIGYMFYLAIRFVFRTGSLLQGGNYVIRRTALEKIGGYDTNIEFYGEDTDVARRANKVGKVVFTMKLPALSSGRRLAKEGLFTMGTRYATNILSITFLKHPFTQKSIDVRPENEGGIPYKPEQPIREWAIRVAVVLVPLIFFAAAVYIIYRLVEIWR